jgi:hypothetical protein
MPTLWPADDTAGPPGSAARRESAAPAARKNCLRRMILLRYIEVGIRFQHARHDKARFFCGFFAAA